MMSERACKDWWTCLNQEANSEIGQEPILNFGKIVRKKLAILFTSLFVLLRPRFLVVLLAAGVTACGPPTGEHWKEIGNIESDFIRFVQIDAASAHDGTVYQEVAEKLSGTGTWQIGFFLQGDSVPPNAGSRADFFSAGGWKGYRPAAIYMHSASGENFTLWDYEKAGTKDAPLSALCGAGAKEQYNAVQHLAARDGWTRACGLTDVDGKSVVTKFAIQFETTKKEFLMKAYNDIYTSSLSGPDDRANCSKLRAHIEADARDGREILINATPTK